MRNHLVRIAVALLTALSFTAIAQPQFGSAPSVQAKSWDANPAPYNRTKVDISPAALLGLQRQGSGINVQDIGVNNGSDTLHVGLPQPRKPQAAIRTTLGPGGVSSPGPQGGIDSVPSGSILFNDDPSALEQNETSVTVRQSTPVMATGTGTTDAVVGGVNDFRGFYYVPSAGCTVTPGSQCYPARNCPSLSGFSVSLNGGSSLTKSGCLPWANQTFQPFGDPALDRDASGNVYYGSLGFDQTAGSGQNGIILERSTPSLFDSSNTCQNVAGTSPTDNTNPCWTGRVIFVGNTSTNPNTGKCDVGFCTFADKDWVAVDRYSNTVFHGDVYVAWNSFTVAGEKNGQSQMLLARCTPDVRAASGFQSCTNPITVSAPGDVYTGGGSYLTVTRDGHVLVAYANFGTATTLYPIDYRIAVLAPGGQSVEGYINQAHLTEHGDASTVPCLPNRQPAASFEAADPCQPNTGVDAAAGVTFRLPEFYKIDADRSTRTSQNTVYTTFELCVLPQYYPGYDNNGNLIYPGNCPKTDVMVATTHLTFANGGFSSTPSSYQDITSTAPGQQFMPSVSVDDGTGNAVVSYNSTQDDPFQNMDSVYLQEATAGGSFGPLAGTTGGKITPTPYQITKDPAGYFGQGFPGCGGGLPGAAGCPGYAPENGDYLQSLAYFGRVYTHYAGTYVQKAFTPDPTTDALTFVDATLPMQQDDNYLARNAE